MARRRSSDVSTVSTNAGTISTRRSSSEKLKSPTSPTSSSPTESLGEGRRGSSERKRRQSTSRCLSPQPKSPEREASAEDPTLQNVGYPIYCMHLTEKHLFLAGGGGNTKSGVKNSLTIFRIQASKDPGQKPSFVCDVNHLLPQDSGAIWNLAVSQQYKMVACGIDAFCEIFSFEDGKCVFLCRFQTDFLKSKNGESYQKFVRFNLDGSLLLTGGTDKIARLWNVTHKESVVEKSPSLELKSHTDELNDGDFYDELLATASAEKIVIWKVDKGTAVQELSASALRGDKTSFRFCRFGCGDSNGLFFSAELDVLTSGRRLKRTAYITQWDCEKWKPIKTRNVAASAITSLHISVNGEFIAFGTSEGVVGVLSALTLKKVFIQSAFKWPVTAVTFSATSKSVFATCGSECKIFAVQKKSDFDVLLALIALIVIAGYYYAYQLYFVK